MLIGPRPFPIRVCRASPRTRTRTHTRRIGPGPEIVCTNACHVYGLTSALLGSRMSYSRPGECINPDPIVAHDHVTVFRALVSDAQP